MLGASHRRWPAPQRGRQLSPAFGGSIFIGYLNSPGRFVPCLPFIYLFNHLFTEKDLFKMAEVTAYLSVDGDDPVEGQAQVSFLDTERVFTFGVSTRPLVMFCFVFTLHKIFYLTQYIKILSFKNINYNINQIFTIIFMQMFPSPVYILHLQLTSMELATFQILSGHRWHAVTIQEATALGLAETSTRQGFPGERVLHFRSLMGLCGDPLAVTSESSCSGSTLISKFRVPVWILRKLGASHVSTWRGHTSSPSPRGDGIALCSFYVSFTVPFRLILLHTFLWTLKKFQFLFCDIDLHQVIKK